MPGNLTNTIEQLAHEMQERTGVTVIVDVDISLESALVDVSGQIAHIVREALSNVGRHAGAATCRVSIRRDGTAAVVEIDDDGHGFDIAHAHRGMGMGNLAERAESIHATLDVESEPGHGTVIRLTIPL